MISNFASVEDIAKEIEERLSKNPVKILKLEVSSDGLRYKIFRTVGEHSGTSRGRISSSASVEDVRKFILPKVPINYTTSLTHREGHQIYLTVIPKPGFF